MVKKSKCCICLQTDLQGGPGLPSPEVKVVVVPGAEDLQDPISLLDVPLT